MIHSYNSYQLSMNKKRREPEMLEKYNSESFVEQALCQKQAFVMEFSSTTCAHCRKMEKVLQKLAANYEEVKFGTVDISEDMNLAKKYDVHSVPTIIFMKNGEMVQKVIGDTHELVIIEHIKRLI